MKSEDWRQQGFENDYWEREFKDKKADPTTTCFYEYREGAMAPGEGMRF